MCRGQLLLKPCVFLAKLDVLLAKRGVLFLQLRNTFHRSEEFFLQLGHALGQPLRFGIMAYVPQLHGAGQYCFTVRKARAILGLWALECFQIVRPRGPPPGENLARVFWLL